MAHRDILGERLWDFKGAWVLVFCCLLATLTWSQETVRIGFNYPETGPYAGIGLDELRATEMGVEEINAHGGILGRPVEIVIRDTQSINEIGAANARELIEQEGVVMVTGGASSGVAIAVGDVCFEKRIPFMATISISDATTCEGGHRTTFRGCYNGWMGASALADYLNERFSGKRYLYIVADYTWGWTSEASMRTLTHTQDVKIHKQLLTPLGAPEETFSRAVRFAKMMQPDVLVLVLFGRDMGLAIKQATLMGLKSEMQIVVPLMELSTVEQAGPKVMEGVMGAMDWNWRIPYDYGYERGQQFVETFKQRYGRYPCTGAAAAYTNLMQYRDAVQRAGTLDVVAVVEALEDHRFTLLKDEQQWRGFDHQGLQTVYLVKCKTQTQVLRDPFKLDYFENLEAFSSEQVARSHSQWMALRQAASLPTTLEALTSTPGLGSRNR